MASVCSPRRQLAPTVGHEVALAGVHIRAGILDINGERTVSALVQRIYNMDFINDNAGCFANGGKFPQNGRTIEFGSIRVYFGTVPVRQRLSPVLVAPDPPRWLCAGRAAGSVEVMMAGAVNTGKGAVEEGDERAASTRPAKPPLERDAGIAGASSAPPATPLQAAMHTLATPIAQNIDPAKAQEELEATRKALLTGGADIIRAQRELNLTLREYNAAHGFASVSAHAARIPENRLKARNLDQDLRKEVLTGKSASVSVSIVEKPKYSSPDKTIKAAKAAVELCESLSGDELAKQQERVKELLKTIEQQNAEQLAKLNEAVASKSARSTKNAGSKSQGQASSPHPDKRREREKNARQMTVYDPVLAGKQKAGQHDAGRKSQGADRGYAKGGYAGNNHAGRYETGQNYRAARVAYVDEEMPPPGYRQARAAEPEEYDESDSEVERTRVHRNPLGERLGERCLPDRDARHRLDRVHLSAIVECEGPPGPRCFGPRIMREEPPVRNFQLPRDTRTYDGTTKPEDWLADYVTAVYVAGGGVNRRWAVRIIPSYLVGPARIWLNNLPAGSINGWLDFEEAFVNNFSSTYKRPNRPQQLALCQQRAGEPDRDYLTRWNSMRNTCEGVIEAQAIAWFSQGCRRGSPLWQRLQRSMPTTLAEMIRVADSYALGDPMQPAVQAEPEQSNPHQQQYRDNRNNKRREDFPDRRYASQQVAAVQENYDASGSQRQKTGSQPWAGPKKQWVEKKPWGQKKNWQEPVKYTMEAAMDQPCRWHTPNPDHPSNHLTKDCSWTKFLMQKGAVKDAQAPGGPVQQQQQLPPPPPLTGANALPVQPQPNRQQYQQVNRVEENRDQPPPPAPLGRNVYEDPHLCMVVFVTEPTDRQSVHRRSMEVNAVMPAVPKYMLWSDQEITWSFKDHPKDHAESGWIRSRCGPNHEGAGNSSKIQQGVPRELAEHSLNVRKDAKPVRQPLRRFAEDRRKIIGEEVTKLLVAGFIVEVTHTEWLANPVMVEKKKDENLEAQAPKVWRMCIDYTNLNKACPRDPFPLPRIDQVIDSTAGCELEEEGKTVQRPVYYLSEVLSSSKQNYPHFQKMTYGVFMAATKLKHYFEEHPMKVVSEAPISDIMGNKDASGRIAKWAIQLSPYVPVYERRDAIKSQALADFLVDWAEIQYKPPEHKIEYWKMHFDGSKLKEGLGAGVVLTSPKGDHLRYVLQVHFRASNNVAEYEALIHGLKVAKEIGALRIICYGDSDLVVQQCSGDWDAKDANMASYRFHVQKIAGFFEGCEFHHVPRAENEAADTLSKLGSSRQEIPPGIALAHLRVPSIKPSPESESIFVPESHVVPMEIDEGNPGTVPANSGTVPVNSGTATPMPEEAMLVDSMDIDMPVFVVREAPSWVKPIKEFLINGTLPVDENESRRIQRRSKAYTIINGEVYKRSVTGVLQRCVEPEEGREMLEEIHRGECGHHASSRALVAKVFRHGFYWPTALDNAEDLVRKCNGCQRYAKQNHTPASGLKTIPLTWPFAVWCLDMVGPFKTARGNMTHILVMVDKFTKWLEVKPIAKCDGHTAVKFLKDVILRYGYPHNIITDNGTNFAQGEFKRFCEDKNIRLDLCSVAHPQGNGQVERTNALVLSGIKPRLIDAMEKSPGCWIDELPSVLWSLRTTPNRSTGYTPFFMVYGAEAVIPTDILHDSPRVQLYTEEEVKEARENDVDLLEEARELALARTAIYQQNLRRYHSRKVNPRVFREGDLVLRLVQRTEGRHKLSPPWEGPFIVSKALHNDAYYLIDAQEWKKGKADKSGEETKRPWNVALLRPFYS
ncbi:hypothetical protein QYE76_030462 [Lolium multiflorum]|uniref:Integrase catalytic domain-containing protein n=1 Tax=Lolium multiflorum TaxID=4521 RepID=A0AAD8QRK5_LOLMU|nr:hypothetical protein QYE76_030462 [Lolium multiflorum]